MKAKLIILVLLFFALDACSLLRRETSSQPTSPITEEISSDVDILEAINSSLAVEAQIPRLPGSHGYPEAPRLTEVVLATRAEAYPDAPEIDDPERPMWIVKMVGKRADPLPHPAEQGITYHAPEFIIDGSADQVDA